MLAFSNDYYGMIFRATQSVELFCAYEIATSCIMGIYIVHPFILSVIVHFIPMFATNGSLNLIYWMITLLASSNHCVDN